MRVNPLSNGFPNAEVVGARLTKTMPKVDMSRSCSLSLTKRSAVEASKMFSSNECSYSSGEEEDSKLDCQAILAVEGAPSFRFVLPLPPRTFRFPPSVFWCCSSNMPSDLFSV